MPHFLSDSLLDSLINTAVKYRDRIDPSLMLPQVNWRRTRNDRRQRAAESPERVPRARLKGAAVVP
jgi:UDP-sulfoquinovose synthase